MWKIGETCHLRPTHIESPSPSLAIYKSTHIQFALLAATGLQKVQLWLAYGGNFFSHNDVVTQAAQLCCISLSTFFGWGQIMGTLSIVANLMKNAPG